MAEDMLSLMSLEDELSCSICLCPFECPVTIPCGHNFCQDCLLKTWKENYSCPQCRTHFTTKPELKKNTVLSTVVETFKVRSNKDDLPIDMKDPSNWDADKKEPKEAVILCDTCMEAKAFKTCLTCMASFCVDHVRPHQENPVFAAHQLNEPLGDLLERICSDHHKLMDFYCVQHGRCICSVCLQQVHKGCTFSNPDEQRALKESDLRGKLGLLDGKIDKNQTVISQMREQQSKLKDSAAIRKRNVANEYRLIRELLDGDEREALNMVDRELESGHTKLQNLMKKFNKNIEQLTAAKDSINSLLSQTQSLAFLQASVDLPSVVVFDPFAPKISLENSKSMTAWTAYSAVLREHLTHIILKQPVEGRLQILKPELNVGMLDSGGVLPPPPGPPRQPRSHSPGAALKGRERKKNSQDASTDRERKSEKKPDQKKGQEHKAGKNQRKPPQYTTPGATTPNENFRGAQEPRPRTQENPGPPNVPINITSAAKRNDLLQYGTVLTFDPKTAHKRISLTDNLTTACVLNEPANYPDGPARFSVCSQVLTSKGFSRGRHYWEVKMSSNNFTGIGLAYNSIDRKGPSSRLGRNAQSWCVEWFNVKLSAWHASNETVLANPNPTRVGVLLDCDEGTATLYNVQDRAYPFHTFVFHFAEAVYPAFWLFSSGASVNLCKLQS